jgi:hypothetical protein
MESFNLCISLIFGLIAFLTAFTFFRAINNVKGFAIAAVIWVVLQSGIALSGFYTNTNTIIPRLLLVVGPPVVLMAWLFLARPGKDILEGMDMHLATVIHVVRAPLEVILYWLYLAELVPREMTFGGGNLDMISGITAPVVYYWGIMKGRVRWQLLVIWNLLGLGLLLNAALKSVLSAPYFFQTIAFDQPNVAVLKFPFIFLPGVVVPIIVCAHLAVIRNLVRTHWYEHKPGALANQVSIKS